MKIIILNTILLVCISSQVNANNTAMPVYTTKITTKILKEKLSVFGIVKNNNSIKVESQYSGRLTSLHIKIGKFVKKGALLVTLQTQKAEALKNNSNYALKDIKIYAPIGGYITNQYVHVGEIVTKAQPIIKIVSTKNRYLSIDVPSQFLHKLKINLPIKVGTQEITFEVDRVIPIVNPITHTFKVFSYIKNNNLFTGEVYKVVLILDKKRVKVIDRSAVLSDEGKKYVFVILNAIAKKISVKTGLSNDKFIEIKKGVKPNDEIVVLGNYELYDGIHVEIKHK